jgi:hypothetical protein
MVKHCSESWVAHAQFACYTEVSIPIQDRSNLVLIQDYFLAPSTLVNHVFQHLLVLLYKTTSVVIAKNAQEHILAVDEMRHILDEINVSMLRILAWCVFRPPQ